MANEKRLIEFEKARKSVMEILAGKVTTGIAVKVALAMQEATLDAVEVPCKIGDLVWGIRKFNHETERAKQGIVHEMFFGEDMRLCICVKGVCRGEWGKNVFATKEEALAKMDGDGNV